MTELSADSTEHEMVIAALQPMDPGRKCFRLIGDVLVERTVGETLPAVEKTRANLDLMIASLQTQLQQVGARINLDKSEEHQPSEGLPQCQVLWRLYRKSITCMFGVGDV